jgi:hypothetical protein
MIFLAFLSLALLVALIWQHRTVSRERQETLAGHANELARADRAHRLEMQEVRRQLDEQMLLAKHERAELIDRLHTTAADQVAAVVRQMPVPEPKEKQPELPVLRFDDDLSLAEALSN